MIARSSVRSVYCIRGGQRSTPVRRLMVETLGARRVLATTIDVGDHVLQPDAPDQIIDIRVDGDSRVTGLNLRAQIGDGPGGPVFQAVEFSDGADGLAYIWDEYPTTEIGQAPVPALPHVAQISVLFTNSGDDVVADGLIARITVDTTGVDLGVFSLNLDDTVIERTTDFILTGAERLEPTIINGTIRINSHPWHNADLPVDVDADGNVFPIDALLVVNGLNSRGIGPLPDPPVGEDQPPPFVDVVADNWLMPIDALVVVNALNNPSSGEGESEMSDSRRDPRPTPTHLTDAAFGEYGKTSEVTSSSDQSERSSVVLTLEELEVPSPIRVSDRPQTFLARKSFTGATTEDGLDSTEAFEFLLTRIVDSAVRHPLPEQHV